jgi:hypothetical protein
MSVLRVNSAQLWGFGRLFRLLSKVPLKQDKVVVHRQENNLVNFVRLVVLGQLSKALTAVG